MGYIDKDGNYQRGHIPLADATPQKTTVWKQSDHDRQRTDHREDLIKPYLPNGEPNPEFINQYPEESKTIYGFIPTDEKISKEH